MWKILLEIIKDITPSNDLPNPVWLSRTFVLLLSAFGFVFFIFKVIEDTDLAKQYGLIKIERKTRLTHVGFTLLVRNIRSHLRRITGDITAVKVALVITSYEPGTGEFLLKPDDSDRFLIWEFAAPNHLNLQVSNLEIYFRGANEELSSFARDECTISPLSPEAIEILGEGALLSGIDYWLKCPVYPSKDSSTPMAHIVLFLNSKELEEDNISDLQIISRGWTLSERVRDSYSYFNTNLVVKQRNENSN